MTFKNKIFLFFLFITLGITKAQNVVIDSTTIKEIMVKKKVALEMNASCRELDLLLFENGCLPEASVKQVQPDQLAFELFRDYSKVNKDRYEQRLKNMFPTITTLSLDFEKNLVSFVFRSAIEEKTIHELVKIFSYNGFVIRN